MAVPMVGHKMISLIAFGLLFILTLAAFIVALIKTTEVDHTETTTYDVNTVATFDVPSGQNTTIITI